MKYIIAAIPRSGSSLLGDHLVASDVAGQPREYINISRLKKDRALLQKIGFQQYLNLITATHSCNGVFGIKILSVQFFYTAKEQYMAIHRLFQNSDKVIYIKRRHRLKQAISAVKALQTSQYHSLSQPSKIIKPKFDFNWIQSQIIITREHEEIWENYFKKTNVIPHEVVYEDFVSDIDGTVNSILRFLGLNPETYAKRKDSIKARSRQFDKTNQEWLERYLETVGMTWEKYNELIQTDEWMTHVRSQILSNLDKARQKQIMFNASNKTDRFYS